ncbi:S24 family peptidase [Rhizobium halophytocola]|uniref:SOS-response transcriptional repressor LexA n=1 Tax=Rhizobium halophytocola TaxID=735519 RepID=A0ABS4DXY0_9HYPH|nr:S24 family peptidase [Rhizobium halophytocola]MBP1850535.1 SOS-response transcriptional repressor LexA [Rhizobium halophytocola]
MTQTVLEQILSRVQRRLEALGITEHAAEVKAQAKVGTIRNWRRGAMPRIETLKVVAPALATTPEWLAYGVGPEDTEAQTPTRPAIAVPRISWVSAGAFAINDSVLPTDEFDTVYAADLPDGEWYAFDIPEGYDSMDRISPPGSVIIVNRKSKRLIPNACYVITDTDGAATYKRYRQSPARFEPVSTNPAHEPLFPDKGNLPGIFGRVYRSYINM